MELTVIVPCLNEAGNLPELVRRVGEVFRIGELLPPEAVWEQTAAEPNTFCTLHVGTLLFLVVSSS